MGTESKGNAMMKKLKELPLRTKILVGLLLLLAVAACANWGELYVLKRGLAKVVDEELRGDGDTSAAVMSIAVGKEWLVLGAAEGRAEVAIREELPGHKPVYRLREHIYRYERGEDGPHWVLESACALAGDSALLERAQRMLGEPAVVPQAE